MMLRKDAPVEAAVSASLSLSLMNQVISITRLISIIQYFFSGDNQIVSHGAKSAVKRQIGYLRAPKHGLKGML